MRLPEPRWALVLAALLLPTAARAQATACFPPSDLPRPALVNASEREPRRLVPTTGYTLALSWSPQYCRERGGQWDARFQCGNSLARFGFILHGLWPDGRGGEWPQYCRAVPLLTDRQVRDSICATPSPQLQQHEWAKHGSCMANTPEAYFREARQLFGAVRFPDMAVLSRRPGLTPRLLAKSIADLNEDMAPEMMRIRTGPGGWLQEVWLCLGHDRKPTRCQSGDGDAAPNSRLNIWRGGKQP